MNRIPESELILNSDGSVYHLHLRPEDIADTIILVGDPDRVPMVSRHFDSIIFQTQKREFVTHTGFVGKKKLSVLSTGIGTDNIDIVLTELDALVNVDFATRIARPQHTELSLIRIGTSGCLQPDIPIDSIVASEFGLGFDNLLHYYHWNNNEIEAELSQHLPNFADIVRPYIAQGSTSLIEKIAQQDIYRGITATCSGFYGPQGRQVRLRPRIEGFLDQLRDWRHEQHRITNFEMETSGIYGMARLLGHQALSTNAIVAQRARQQFSSNPTKTIENLIQTVLQRLTS